MRRTASQFGLTDEQWDNAKRQVRSAILEAAYDRRMTWYGEVAARVDLFDLEPYSALMNHLLGAVFEDERDAGRPALTSIVTHKYGDKEPGSGFYAEARALGYRFTEPFIFWAEQVQNVFKCMGAPTAAASRQSTSGLPNSGRANRNAVRCLAVHIGPHADARQPGREPGNRSSVS